MNRKMWKLTCVLGLCVAVVLLFGQLAAQETAKTAFTYIGSAKCKMCHSSEKSGGQYKIWEASAHAKAFTTLQSEEANKIATEKGLKVPAAEAPECLGCHTTGYGATAEVRGTLTNEEGVGCEACHGPGSEYKSMATMKKAFAGEIEPASVGLHEINEATCQGCHNEKSPTFKGFDFAKFSAQIAHPVPAEK